MITFSLLSYYYSHLNCQILNFFFLYKYKAYEYNEEQVKASDVEYVSMDDADEEDVTKEDAEHVVLLKAKEDQSHVPQEEPSSIVSDQTSSTSINRLHEIKTSIGLRGGGDSHDATALLSEAKELAKAKFKQLFAFLNGEDQVDPSFIVREIVSESNALSHLQNKEKVAGGNGNEFNLSTLDGMDLDIFREQVSIMFEKIQKQMNFDLKAHSEYTTDLVERALVDMSNLDKIRGKVRRLNEDQEGQEGEEDQNEEEEESFGSFKDTFYFDPRGANQHIHTIMREAYSEGRKRLHSRFKQKMHSSKNNQDDRRRRHLEEAGTCAVPCEIDDMLCNCRKLYECASEMSAYDLSVLYLKGFIEEDGNVTVSVDAFDSIVPLKFHTIKTMVSDWNSEVSHICQHLAHFLIIMHTNINHTHFILSISDKYTSNE